MNQINRANGDLFDERNDDASIPFRYSDQQSQMWRARQSWRTRVERCLEPLTISCWFVKKQHKIQRCYSV